MSIIINGMEMPKKGCIKMLVLLCDGKVIETTPGCQPQPEEQNYEAVSIPPHGRLIDADELTEQLDGIWDCNDMVFEDDNICERVHADCNSCRWRETRDYIANHIIKHAPTIIPEEGV